MKSQYWTYFPVTFLLMRPLCKQHRIGLCCLNTSYRMIFVLLLLSLANAQKFDIDCETGSEVCGEQTAAAAKCLTPCFKEAQNCFKQVGTVISRIQQCMLDLAEDERSDACNECIGTQLDLHCDEYFAEYEEQCGGGAIDSDEPAKEDKFYFKTHKEFAKFCRRLGTKAECVEMGCNFAKRGGCDGKVGKNGEPKLKCKRIRNRSMCNSVKGCTLRRPGKEKSGSGKKKVCKGDAMFPEGME